MIIRRYVGAAVAALLVLFAAGPAAGQVTTGTLVGTVRDSNGVVPGASVIVREVNKGTSDSYVTDDTGSYTAAFLTPGTYLVEVSVPGFKKWVRDGVILQVNQRARVDVAARGGRHRRNDHRCRRSAAAADGLVRGRDGHRGAGDQGAAAERPQLRHPGLPDAGHHPRTGQREPVGGEHVQPAGRLELQRARPPGQRQRLADRRHRQQRVHLQHGDHRAVGRAGPRVQGADRACSRPSSAAAPAWCRWRRSRAATPCAARCSSTCATTRSTRATSSCARRRSRTAR